jgi:hypothetical protein
LILCSWGKLDVNSSAEQQKLESPFLKLINIKE